MKFGSSWKIQSPCNGCSVRELGCHSKCDKYADYQNELFEYKKKVLRRKAEDEIVKGYVVKEQIKIARSKIWER